MVNLHAWAIRWGVPVAAVEDLREQMGAVNTGPQSHALAALSEGALSVAIRLEASRKGLRLWRNNVGALQDQQGRMIRYGLANDSKQMNARIKSSDLIGIRPVTIGPEHLGQVLGQFVAREVKAGGWRWGGTEREQAQLRFLELVVSLGGDAAFSNREGTL